MHVAIVGAGIAGLYAGLLLRREGHQVTIYERTPRVGGRIFTHHFTSPGASKDAFFEAGAMRIPRSRLHSRVFEMIDYLNETGTKSNRIKLIPYELLGNDQAFFHGRKRSRSDHEWTAEADLPSGFRGKSAEELLQSVVRPWVELLLEDFEAGFAELLQYDELSFREYLRQHAKWPSEVIDYVELFCSQTNQYHLSFTDIIMQCVDFGTKNVSYHFTLTEAHSKISQWTTIEGGMSRLPERAASLIGFQNIILSAEVIDLVDLKSGSVEIRAKSPSGIIGGIYDTVILAIPPQAVQRIPRRPQWSPQKEQAIRSIHFQPLYKMGLHFKTRFWEHFSLKPRLGGQDSTDLRFRWIIYPSNGVGSSGSGVLLVYCWMEDAGRLSILSKQDRWNVGWFHLARFFAA